MSDTAPALPPGMPPATPPQRPSALPPAMPPAGAPKGMPPPGAPKAAPPGGMPGGLAGGAMGGTMGGAAETPALSYRRLVRWSLTVVGGAWGGFLLAVGLETARKLLMQVNATLLGGIVSALRGAGAGMAGAGMAGAAGTQLARDAAVFALLSVGLIGLQFAVQALSVWVDTGMVRRLQQRLHDTLLGLGPAYHDRHDPGRTQMVVMSFAAGAQPTLRQFIAFPLMDGITLAGALYFLFRALDTLARVPVGIDAVLAAVLILLPVAGTWLSRRVGRASAASIQARQALNTEFLNSAQMPAEVQVMGAAPQRSRAFARRLDAAIRTQRRAQMELQAASQVQDAVPTLLEAGFVIYAVFVALATGSAQAGAIVTILLLVPQVVAPVRDVISFLTGLSAAWPMVAEVGALLDAAPERPAGGAPFPADAPADVTLEEVRFAYAPGAPAVLDGITHTFRAGTVSAIVGRSGTGKSSILRLIAGLRTPDAGDVRVGGVPVAAIDAAALREAVVTVSQFPLFITDTVRANFQLMHEAATDDAIEAACRATGLWPVLLRQAPSAPLDAPMAPSGQGLSGGERRLFAVTRALLRAPRVLLLDEPTTGIDAIGVDLLERCLRVACAGMTVIMVEHHLEFVRRMADEVCCLEDGRFAAVGPPALLAQGTSLFARLLQVRQGLGSTDGLEISSVPRPVLGGKSPQSVP